MTRVQVPRKGDTWTRGTEWQEGTGRDGCGLFQGEESASTRALAKKEKLCISQNLCIAERHSPQKGADRASCSDAMNLIHAYKN